jgi:hypothetical protein
MSPRHLAVAAFLLAAAAPSLRAQRLTDLPGGTPLRLRTAGERAWREATLDAVTPDSLAFRQSGQRFTVPRSQLRTVELRDPDRSRVPHVIVGGVLGAVVGVVAVVADVNRCEQRRPRNDLCGLGIILTPPAALLGATLGGLVGALLPVDRWHTVEQL